MKIVLLLAFVGLCSAGHWSYGNPDWAGHYPDCGGRSQSPIDVSAGAATCGGAGARPGVSFGGSFSGTAVNNGHSIQVNAPGGMKAIVNGKSYEVLQFHFHWGKVNSQGSEHTDNGAQHSMEMHVVCGRNNNAELAVLGFFYDVGAVNGNLQPLVNVIGGLANEGSQQGLNINLAALVGPAVNGDFYSYSGSLTTPPCSEIVAWTVYKTPLQLSASQIAAFRGTSVAGGNFRPTQALNGRTILNSAC